MQKINPCLWFDHQAEEAAAFYVSVFKNSKIVSVARYGESAAAASGQPKGTVMMVTFKLNGQGYLALNGGPHFKFSPAISLMVYCESQQEIDYFWDKLSEGGEKGQCGWLTDKFGVSWQIVPTLMDELMGKADATKSERVMKAVMQMTKLDIAALKRAYEGK